MATVASPRRHTIRPEPRWPVWLAFLAVCGLYLALPENLTLGPTWLLPILVAAILTPTIVAHWQGRKKLNRRLGLFLIALITAALAWSMGALIIGLPAHRQSATGLLRSASALWASNILVFAIWYWKLDAGGPHARDARGAHVEGSFLFPQMTLQREGKPWRPGFVDYLFLAFNTSTAFSPTDVPPLTRWAKLLMMSQSIISLGAIVILAGRAVNML
ncbi:MAG: hypothetical protein P4K98_08420 [Bryobacteraceae bacterium]|nr:hypothetical protein [Bryobacteraceae bacterium]